MARISVIEQIESTLKAQLMDMPDGGAFHDHIRDGIVSENVADVLIDTMSAVNRDFLMLLHIPKEPRNVFIIKLAHEIYLQWCEHGIIQGSVIANVDEYAYHDEWRNEGREIGDSA